MSLISTFTSLSARAWQSAATDKIFSLVNTITKSVSSSGNSEFGYRNCISNDGNTLMIADQSYGSADIGAVYLYTKSSGLTYTQTSSDTGSTGNKFLGYQLALSGDGTYAAAIYRTGADPGPYTWYARIYTISGGIFSLQTTITLPSPFGPSPYNNSMDMNTDGSKLVLGVFGYNKALVYSRSGTTWSLQQTLTDPAGTGNNFGVSVSIDGAGTTLCVGSFNNGKAYTYTLSGSTWSLQQTLTYDVGVSGSQFGMSVDLNVAGTMLAIGDEGDGTAQSCYIFTYSGGSWTKQSRIQPDPSFQYDAAYGRDVSLGTNCVVVGAPFYTDTVSQQGTAFVYQYDGLTWNELNQFIGDPSVSTLYGIDCSLCPNDGIFVVGSNPVSSTCTVYEYAS